MTTVPIPPEARKAMYQRNAWVYARYLIDEFGMVHKAEWFVYYTPDHTPPPGAVLVSDPIWLHPEEMAKLTPAEREYYLGGRVRHEPESSS